jgi:DNA-binding transcriptional LysR family regulator
MICAAPSYLAGKPPLTVPADLARHACIAMTVFGQDSWSFPAADGDAPPQQVRIAPRLAVNTVEAAVASAVEGRGLVRLFSFQVAEEVAAGRLQIVLRDSATAALPVHLIMPEGRLSVAKVRAFVDFAVPRLKEDFDRMGRQ